MPGERTILVVLATEEVNVALENAIKEVTEEENVDGQERSISTELTNLFSDNLKFVLKRGVTLLFLELIHNLTKSGELTDNSDNHIT